MQGFAYTARDASGGTKRGFVPAPDRAAAIRDIRALGLVPIDLQEADGPAIGPGRGLPRRTLIIAAAALVVLVIGLVVVRRPAPTAPVARLPVPDSRHPTPVAHLPTPDSRFPTPVPRLPTPVSRPVSPDSRLPQPADPAVPEAPAEPEEPAVLAATEEPPEEKPKLPQAFYKSLTEQYISMLGRPGESMPPIPLSADTDLREDLKRALTNLIEIYETDDAHAVNHKETIAWIKVQLADMEQEGWNPAEVIKALEARRKDEAAERRAAAQILEQMRQENPEQAEAARQAINAELMEKGIIPLEAPPE